MKLVELPRHTCMDIPLRLRSLADDLEALGDNADASAVCVVVTVERVDGDIEVYGYGRVGPNIHIVGLLEYAKSVVMGSNGRDVSTGGDAA